MATLLHAQVLGAAGAVTGVGGAKRAPGELGSKRVSTNAFFGLNLKDREGFVNARRGFRVAATKRDGRRTNVARVVSEKVVGMEVESSNSSVAPAAEVEYHFLVANAKFMLDEEEHFQELMRERLRHFGELNREQDFWLVIEPKFLANFPDMGKRLGRPAVALVSTDSTWITFMKLRLDRVLKGVYKADTVAEALDGGNSEVEINFEKPGRWTAPYSKYEGPWWTPFLPTQ